MESYILGGDSNGNKYFQDQFKGVLDLDKDQEVLQEMENTYIKISLLLPEIEENEIEENRFREIIKVIDAGICHLEVCLDCIGWEKNEAKKFEDMYKYYRESKLECMDKFISKITIKADDYMINNEIQKMFDDLSFVILNLHSFSAKDISQKFKDIESKLDSDEAREQLTLLQYRTWGNKYNQAMDYIKQA